MPYKRIFDRGQIIRLSEKGYSSNQIAGMIGAKSATYVRKIVHGYQSENPGWYPGIKCENPDLAPLDIGKVRALTKAGWDLAKIHEEFGGDYSEAEIMEAMME